MAAGDPTGADLCSGTTPGDTLPNWGAGYEEREITFGAGAALTSGVKYAIVVRALDAAGSRNDSDALVAVKWNVGTYADGSWYRSTDSGGTWTEDTGDDAWFKTKAGAVEKDTYEPAPTLGYEPAFKAWWIAQTFTASSSYTITSVILKMERFQFDTTGTVTVSIKATVGIPEKPTNPTPANNATGVDFSGLVLDWDDGGGADTFDVYIGPSGSLVEVASAIVPSTYTVSISDVPTEQVIYWRVDATNASGTTTGGTWNFDARPVKANTPSPANAASDITLDETPLGWVDGGNSDTYDIYFRIQGDSWVEESSAQAAIEWAIVFGTLGYDIIYEWKIESTNIFGTTVGDTWSFDSLVFDEPRISYVLISGGSGAGPYDDPAGVEGTDWSWTGLNNMMTVRRLVAAARNKIFYET